MACITFLEQTTLIINLIDKKILGWDGMMSTLSTEEPEKMTGFDTSREFSVSLALSPEWML